MKVEMGIHVTDEMVARYLSGEATPEEESAVLDYMSENDEHIEDLLAMTAAVEICSIKGEETESRKDEKKRRITREVVSGQWPVASGAGAGQLRANYSKERVEEEENGRRVRPLWPVISAAASVALLIGVGIALWHNSMSNGVNVDPAPSYAEQDMMDTVRSYE